MTRRSTSTVTVLSILSLVTRPVRTRLGIPRASLSLGRGGAVALAENGFHARDLAPHLAHAPGAFLLAGRALEPQVELFLAQIEQQRAEFVRCLGADIARLVLYRLGHLRRLPPGRRTWCGSAASPRPGSAPRAPARPAHRRPRT